MDTQIIELIEYSNYSADWFYAITVALLSIIAVILFYIACRT